jgi:antitoxin component YwqK of YwqJK toxin-antitoxin module
MGIFDWLKKNKDIHNDNGLNELYYDNGKGTIEEKFNKKNGKIDGVRKSYHRSGRLRNITEYKDGLKDGIFTTFYDWDGEVPTLERKYVKGEMIEEINHHKKKNQLFPKKKTTNNPIEDILKPKNKITSKNDPLKKGLRVHEDQLEDKRNLLIKLGIEIIENGNNIKDEISGKKFYLNNIELSFYYHLKNLSNKNLSYGLNNEESKNFKIVNDLFKEYKEGYEIFNNPFSQYLFNGITNDVNTITPDEIQTYLNENNTSKSDLESVELMSEGNFKDGNIDEQRKDVKRNDSDNKELRVNEDQLEDVGDITNHKGIPFTGIMFWEDEWGDLEGECEMVNGLKNGTFKEYCTEEGFIEEETNYKNDIKDGPYKSYYENKLVEEGNYVNDKRNGISTCYYENGKTESTVNYINDKRDGVFTSYHENGKIESTQTFSEGNPLDDVVKHFDEEGRLSGEDNYKNGKSQWKKNYFKDGSLEKEDYYTDERTRRILYYHENGTIKIESIIKDKVLVSKQWYDDKGNKIDGP